MKDKRLKSLFFAFVIIMVFILSSIGSMGTSIKSRNENVFIQENSPFKAKVQSRTTDMSLFLSKASVFTTLTGDDGNASDNIVVANRTEDEMHPSMIFHNNNALVAYECHNNTQNNDIHLRYSKDFGISWQDTYVLDFDNNLSWPSLVNIPGKDKAYGIFLSDYNQSSRIYEFESDSLTDISKWSISSPLDWSDNNFYNFHSVDIVHYNDVYYNDPTMHDVKYIAAFIGSTDYPGAECQDSIIFLFRTPGQPDYLTIAWDPNIEHCNNISIDVSSKNNLTYGVCEIQNGSNTDIFFFNDNPINNGAGWGDTTSISNQTFTSSENLMRPEILVEDNDIYISVETSTKGIVLYHSSDYGAEGSWTIYNITSDILTNNATPEYPMLISNNSYLSCTFVESGNLSVTKTLKNDINWSQPIQLNDVNGSVSAEYKSYDLGDMDRAVWTDTRDGNKDIYYYLAFIPKIDVAVTDFSITRSESQLFLPTNNLIEITVKNVGDALAENIPINITYLLDDGNTSATDYPGLIDSIDVGQTTTITRPLFRFRFPDFFYAAIDFAGIESITVELDPEGKSMDSDSGNNFVTDDDVDFEKIFPRLAQYEDFLKLLKKIV